MQLIGDETTSRFETTYEFKRRKLIKLWSQYDAIETRAFNKYEDNLRHYPNIAGSKKFGGIARELYLENKPIFTILGLSIGIAGNPIALISHNYQQYQIDISPLFVGLSVNKRKRLLKYNKVDNTFNDKVYKFIVKLVNDNLMTFKR